MKRQTWMLAFLILASSSTAALCQDNLGIWPPSPIIGPGINPCIDGKRSSCVRPSNVTDFGFNLLLVGKAARWPLGEDDGSASLNFADQFGLNSAFGGVNQFAPKR
jgi:hypothetical protein